MRFTSRKVLRASTAISAGILILALTGSFVAAQAQISSERSLSPDIALSNSWSSGAPMLTPRFGPAFGVISGKVYVVGGATSSAIVTTNEVYNPTTNTWATRAPMPTATFAPAAAAVNGILYVMGGSSNGSDQLSVVQAYNPSTNSWSMKSPMPIATSSMYAVAVKGVIYVVGGFANGARTANLLSYNPATDSWKQLASMKVGKSTPATGLLGGIIAAGGLGNGGVVTDNERYSVSGNTWKTLPSIPTARTASCFGKISGKFYVAGGADANQNAFNVLEAYVALTRSWTTSLASMPQAVIGPASAVHNGKLYCIGGANSGIFGQGVPYNNVQIYQP
jgi:N-acetylneuraminic acid mutarotase